MPALAVTPLTTHNIMQISVCVPVLQPADQLANIHRVFTPVCNTTPTPTSGYLPLPPSVAAWAWAGVFTFNSLARKKEKKRKKQNTQFCNLSQPSYFYRLSLGAKHETRHLLFFSSPSLFPYVFIFYLFSSATFDPSVRPCWDRPSAWKSALRRWHATISETEASGQTDKTRPQSDLWTLWTLGWPRTHRASQNSHSWRA